MQNNARIDLRLSHDRKEFLEKAAHLGGYRSLSDFIISAAETSASSILEEINQIELNKSDAAVFCAMLLSDVEPKENVKAYVDQSAKLFQWKRK
jgi:uncharacterized protein (DUF1778 family)